MAREKIIYITIIRKMLRNNKVHSFFNGKYKFTFLFIERNETCVTRDLFKIVKKMRILSRGPN